MHPRPPQELQQHGLRLIIHMMRRQHHLAGAHMPGQARITRTPGSGLDTLFVNFKDFNALHEAGKQIVLTSDRPPKEIPGLESRLVSRFEWGMVADIGQPDLEHRIAILRKKAEQDHLELTIPDDVLRFIAEHVRSSVRELEGCIIKLLLYASLKHREISIEMAREALSDKIRQGEAAGYAPRAK